jgi:ribosomal protein L3
MSEFRLDADEQPEEGEFAPGMEIKVDLFAEGQVVDVIGTTIGKGFAGTVKRHNFSMRRVPSVKTRPRDASSKARKCLARWVTFAARHKIWSWFALMQNATCC